MSKLNKNNINRWIFHIPIDDIRTVNDTNSDECFLCGKKLKKQNYFVHLLTTGEIISSDEAFDNSQGFFSIGSCCKNKIPNNFYWSSK